MGGGVSKAVRPAFKVRSSALEARPSAPEVRPSRARSEAIRA
ncbi:hypothetical protein [Sporosarcina sp. ACRSL]|nr:hypothetical protein [Sporosarcina sp. ACRSL]